jgi:hypothetical protein
MGERVAEHESAFFTVTTSAFTCSLFRFSLLFRIEINRTSGGRSLTARCKGEIDLNAIDGKKL